MKKSAVFFLMFLVPVLLTATPQEDFLCALRENRLNDAAVFLRNGGDINEYMKEGCTPLALMCREQRSNLVRWLIDQGADPDLADRDDLTPLMHASIKGNRDIAQFLLLSGAEINQQDPYGNTPVQIAVNHGHWDLADFLESRGGLVSEGYYEHPVLSEIWTRRQHYREALSLPEKRWPDYSFLLAVRDGKYKEISRMLDEGLSPDAADSEGVTALMFSASLEDRFLSNLLLDKGADIQAHDSLGLTGIWYASFTGRMDLVEALTGRGAEISGSFLENSALFAAFIGKNYNIMDYLLEMGADPKQSGRLGARLVHYAAFLGDLRALKLLDQAGVSLKQRDGDDKTVLDYLIQGYNLSGNELLYLEPARYLKDKKSAYTIDPLITENVKLIKIIKSIW